MHDNLSDQASNSKLWLQLVFIDLAYIQTSVDDHIEDDYELEGPNQEALFKVMLRLLVIACANVAHSEHVQISHKL